MGQNFHRINGDGFPYRISSSILD